MLCKFKFIFIISALCLSNIFVAEQAYSQVLFGSKEIRSSDLSAFKKWTDAMDRYTKEDSAEDSLCMEHTRKLCHMANWKKFIAENKDKSLEEKIVAVQRYINKVKYVLDPINWGVPDYWATPKQFFIKEGDCEDYAIAKFITLKALGVSSDDMRILILQDTNLNLLHSVLVVYVNGQALIMDNQISEVVLAEKIHHYKPIYSVNEKFWWRYRT